MHWVTKPGTSLPEERRIVRAASRELRAHPGRAQLRLAHRPGVPRRRGRRGRTSARTGSASTRKADYDKTVDRRPRASSRASRPVPRRADLPARAHQGGADRRERADRRAHLRRRPRRPAQHGGRSQQVAVDDRRHASTARRAAGRGAPDRGRAWSSAPPSATASSPATCAAPRRRWSPARRSATSSRTARPTTCIVWSTADDAQQPDGDPQPADRHARRHGQVRAGRRGRRRASSRRRT